MDVCCKVEKIVWTYDWGLFPIENMKQATIVEAIRYCIKSLKILCCLYNIAYMHNNIEVFDSWHFE